MRYKTLEDVIQEGREFHLKLSRQYEEFELLSVNERARLLLDQLKRREVSMTHTLENFRDDIGEGALHTWVQFAPEGREPEFLQRLRHTDICDPDAIGRVAMDIEMLELEQLEEHTLSINLFNLRDY